MIAKISEYATSDLPPRIKLAMRLVESWVWEAGQSVDDAFFGQLKASYTDKEIVELTISIGTFDFSHRFNAVMGVVPVHPATYLTNHMGAPDFMKAHMESLGMRPGDVAGAPKSAG